jgi:histidinol dehydrogenase
LIKVISITDVKADAELLRNSTTISDDQIQQTKTVMEEVIKHGDAAVINYTNKFDGVKLNSLRITDRDFKDAYSKVTTEQIRSLKIMKERLMKSELALLNRLKGISLSYDGVRIQRLVQPIPSVGCYIPGGKARYPSTVIMCAVPAKCAGVKRIVGISPPLKSGTIDPLTLVAADICGIDEFYMMGGAQGITALAFGTNSINKVSKIVGPGGVHVTVAKILVSGRVSIDMVAGPTELLVYADSSANPKLVALDLISQAEHGVDTLCGAVTTSQKLAVQVIKELTSILEENKIARADIIKKSLEENGFIAVCKKESVAIEFINELAPEHAEIIARKSRLLSKKIKSAGIVLIGNYTPSSASDYCLGSNHVLPTLGFGKSRGSLSILDFLKIVNNVEATKSGLKNVESVIKEIAHAEGLTNHYESVRKRVNE